MPKRSGSMAYTRQKYIHSKPPLRVLRFTLGDAGLDYEYKITMVAPHSVKLSGKSLEAARVTANKVLKIEAGVNFMLKVVTYPHEIIRSHKFMGFAGADRLSQGMRHSFGKVTERAAMVKVNQIILAVFSTQAGVETAKKALTRASKKLPVSCRIEVEALKKAGEA